MNKLWEELKRRNVVKVAFAYAVVGWVILQFVDIVNDPLGLPDWFQKMVIVLLAIGAPLALIFSWAFELTPDGVKKTAEVDKNRSITPSTGQRINKLTIGALGLAVLFLLVDKFYLSGGETPKVINEAQAAQTTIAVLPFVNMSNDPDQEFFSDGITEEILNVIAKNKSLRVAGRTSSFAYKGQNKDLRKIGEDLGVEYLVEGSVRKSGDTIRVTAQVIQVHDGFHIWSETYDRQLTDIFAIQDEIARAVANTLEVSFGLAEDELLVANTTENMEAYDLFLQAREAHKFRNIQEAIALSKKVVAMEPDFAPGWAVYAQALTLAGDYIHANEPMETTADYGRAEIAAQKALILDPNSVLALGALANVNRTRLNWERAESYYKRALKIDPDNPSILEDYNEFLLTVGKITEAEPYAAKLYRLEPQVPIFIRGQIAVDLVRGRFKEAEVLGEKVYEKSPDNETFVFFYLETLVWSGKYEKARQILESRRGKNDFYLDDFDTILTFFAEGQSALTPEQLENSKESPNALAFLGDTKALFELLDRMIKLGWWGDFFTFSADMKPYYATHEFKEYVKNLRLPEYWRAHGWGDICKPLGENDFECKVVQ